MTFKLYLTILLTSLCHILLGQVYVIPFRLTPYNNLSIQAVLNKTDTVDLMLHTAESSVTMTQGSAKSLRFQGTDSVQSWGGGGNASRYSNGNEVCIGAMKWDSVQIWEDINSGKGTDGKFGLDLFENKVVVLDFDKGVVVVRPDLPDSLDAYQKLRLSYHRSRAQLFIEAGCVVGDSVYKDTFLIHSGYSGSVLLDDRFAADKQLGQRLHAVDGQSLKDSYGHVLKTKKAVLPGLRIGTMQLDSVPVGFFEGAIGRQKISVIGGDVLKRFNIVIDAKREYIYLKPNHFFAPSKILSYVADPKTQDIQLYWQDDHKTLIRNMQGLKDYLTAKHQTLVFGMNGGMFKPDHSPVGLFIRDGKTLAPLDTASGNGNFYLKPNGVFYITTDNQAGICPTNHFARIKGVKFATQSGPMLLIEGNIHPAFREGSANINIRNGVGLLPGGRLLFAMSKEPVNFYDFARFFKDQGCVNALYLDGAVSRMYLPEKDWIQTEGDLGVMIGVSRPDK